MVGKSAARYSTWSVIVCVIRGDHGSRRFSWTASAMFCRQGPKETEWMRPRHCCRIYGLGVTWIYHRLVKSVSSSVFDQEFFGFWPGILHGQQLNWSSKRLRNSLCIVGQKNPAWTMDGESERSDWLGFVGLILIWALNCLQIGLWISARGPF